MSYHHLSTSERTRIEVLWKMGYSTRKIGKQSNRYHSTIIRKLKRNTQKTYQTELADELTKQRHLIYYHPEKKCEKVIQIIQHYLKLMW